MTSQSTTPSTSSEIESTDKMQKQTMNHKKTEKGIGLATGWLRMVEPRKVPYFPQKRDKIVYLRQAHECYLKEVNDRNIFKVTELDKLWIEMKIDVFEFLTITDISFKKYPTRIACLEVRRINQEEKAVGQTFQLKYHDMGDVVDFLVLKHIFNEGLQMKWNVGDRFRCLVGDKWFFGTIKAKEPYEKKFPQSPFKSFQIKWDDEKELDQVSPWELESINKSRLPKNHGEYIQVLNIEIVKMRYKSCSDDWPQWNDWKATIKKIISELDLLMKLPISRFFIEIKKDPIYDALVPYPVDLSTIITRLERQFYRRIDSLYLDIYYIQKNAEDYKPEKFFKEAEHITRVFEDIINKGESDSTSWFSNLEEFLGNFNSSESDDDDNEYRPFASSSRKGRQSNYKSNWKPGCKQLLNTLQESEDMLPFWQPVCRVDYPDYYEVIRSPICLEEILSKFNSDQYESPKDLFDDIKLLITNSRTYNQDKEKAIYHATTRVSALFEELKKQISSKKESPRKKLKKNNHQKRNESDFVVIKSKSPCQKEKEKESNIKKIVLEQRTSINLKNSMQDETTADKKGIDLKNNNYKKNLSNSSSIKNNNTNFVVESSTVIMQNKGKGDKSNQKENIPDKEIPNESSTNKLDISPLKVNTKHLPEELQSVNSNEFVRMDLDENDKVNNSKSSERCEIVENESGNQFNTEPKSPQISQLRRDSTDSVIVIDSDNDDEVEEQLEVSSLEQLQVHNNINNEKDVSKTSQKKSNFKKSLASIKAKKRMQFKYNRIFQPRPCKSCITCQNIKQIYLDHIKSHHF